MTMTPFRFFEITIYSALSFFPYYLTLLLPFKNKLRFSGKTSVLLLFAAWAVNWLIYAGAAFWMIPISWSYLLLVLTGFLFCLGVIDDLIGKSFMTFLILSTFYVFVRTVSKYIEGIFFPGYAMEYYRWTHSLCMIPVEIIALGLNLIYTNRVYTVALRKSAKTRIWKFLWVVPLTFIIIWYVLLYDNPSGDLEASLNIKIVICMSLITIGGWLMDYIIALLIIEQTNLREAEEQKYLVQLEQRHFESQNRRIEDARRARHDLRHHLQIASAFLKENRIDELREYLEEYQQTLPNDTIGVFCENYTINAMMTYYQQRCQERKIGYHAAVNLPREMGISQHDLAVVFGNLLENAADAALEAALTVLGAEVRISAMYDGSMMVLAVENSAVNRIKQDERGRYLSTKHSGRGIGIESVRETVEAYGGSLEIMQENQRFRVRVVMFAKKKGAEST